MGSGAHHPGGFRCERVASAAAAAAWVVGSGVFYPWGCGRESCVSTAAVESAVVGLWCQVRIVVGHPPLLWLGVGHSRGPGSRGGPTAEAVDAALAQPGEAGAAAVGEFSQQLLNASFLFFLFEKFLLFKPASPNKHLDSHIAQLSHQTRDYLGKGLSWPNSSQLGSTVSAVHAAPVCLLLCPSSPMQLQASKSILMLLKPSCLAGEGAIDLALLQESCSRPSGHRAWGCICPGAGPGSRDLSVLNHSPYCLIFQCPLQFWPPNFIYAGIPLAIHSVPQKIG